ncbi:hypothetical protein GCM10010174_36230 [Kutzneria viridogrisea]
MEQPWLFAIGSALAWQLVFVAAESALAAAGLPGQLRLALAALLAAGVPLGVAAACGWWRESGLVGGRPDARWLLALPVLALCLVSGGAGGTGAAALAVGLSAELVSRGTGQFTLRRFGPWRGTLGVVLIFECADLLVRSWDGRASGQVLTDLAFGFALTALRWHVGSVWPLALLHALHAALAPAASWWQLGVTVALLAFGVWLLARVPVVHTNVRPTVRVVCLDMHGRVLLLGRQDPADGTRAWDLPGGGIGPEESPLAAARRELHQETGLPESCVLDRYVLAQRDSYWNGTRYCGEERFYLARSACGPAPVIGDQEPRELALIRDQRWVCPAAASQLPGRVQMTALREIARKLDQ